MITKDVAEVKKILDGAIERMEGGVATYGVFDPVTDKRDLATEAIEEIQDAIIYLSMIGVRLKLLCENLRNSGLY